ncbi:LOW QUALITY PROTEIN: 7SK snRNA methylphosphate capping enzyme [Pangasianodon hypophthalmus]|uniref:LOW QUALITY PROTEIN: 7SK snRNA methylphosphate capping enzyme n=1 Tax=Pangasianodon hypophthalmus TaxID=310915 RepID=UPI0023077CD4|nr:LOW QUALITY PROTEIN: 7SK snRNA methylphosphate capping enzyme [Pangasianodon hypophthalmus]
MIEMSVDKETVLLSDQPAYASLPQQQPELSGNGAEDPQQSAETPNLANEDGDCNLAEENGNKTAISDDVVTQNQDGVQNPKPHQQRPNKRRCTISGGFKHPVFGKRRRRANSESESVLPTNFLLGGNIFDPLNLNSLLDEEVNRALNAETPKSSPLPSKSRDPVEILIPRDITDPLNLNGCTRGDAGIVLTPFKSGGGRRRHRNRQHGGARGGVGRGREGVVGGTGSVDSVGGGEGVAMELNQSEGCLASESECTLASSGNNFQNSPDAEAVLNEDAAECNFPPKQEVHEEKDGTQTPVTHAPHRQRKRKRSSSRSENAGGPCWDKNRTTGPDSAQQHPPHQRGQQRNHHKQNPRNCSQPKPNQQQQQQQQHHHHQQQQQQQKKKFQYGNYNQYYGYRNPGAIEDARIRVFKPEWFQGKEVLDLGCNTGHMTLTIAKNWRPARIVGLDIDGALIHAAKQNIRHYLSEVHTLQARKERNEDETPNKKPEMTKKQRGEDGEEKDKETQSEAVGEKDGSEDGENETDQVRESVSSNGNRLFPVSLCVSRGPIAAPPLPDTPALPPGNFPSNVSFVRGNYVLDSDVLLETQREEFDVILCLSVTKWIHLNWGDVGLRRFFRRVYRHLRPGGVFILEPQPWNSYSKRKKLTETIYKNYFSIQLKPEHFSSFLTSEVGFSSYELLGTPNSSSRGFQRPIYLFHKGPGPQKCECV